MTHPAREIRIVEWPSVALFGLCALLLALNVVASILVATPAPVPITLRETITREVRVIEGRNVECERRRDHIHQRSSFSC